MKELERLLYNTPRPEVRTTTFQQNLRRSLINSGRYVRKGSRDRGFLFFAPTALAVLLAILVVTFVINPAIPINFNRSITPGLVSQNSRLAEAQPNSRPVASLNGNLSNWIEQLQQATEEDMDKAFVRYIAQEQHQFEPDIIRPIGKTRLLAITQYQLSNGQTVLVYTQLPDDQIGYLRAY